MRASKKPCFFREDIWEIRWFSPSEGVVLKASGKVFKARVISEGGSGHHRSAVVEFDDPGTAEVEVVIKDVAGVRERVFKF